MVRYYILPAMSLDGMLHIAMQDRPFTRADFVDFIDGVLDHMQP